MSLLIFHRASVSMLTNDGCMTIIPCIHDDNCDKYIAIIENDDSTVILHKDLYTREQIINEFKLDEIFVDKMIRMLNEKMNKNVTEEFDTE